MQDVNIDLGKEMDHAIPCPPSPEKDAPEKKYYPSLYLDGLENLDLPKSGQLLISYRLRSETHRETEDKASHSFEIEVRSIDGVEGEREEKVTASDDFESRMKKHRSK